MTRVRPHLAELLDNLTMKFPLGRGFDIFVARQTVFERQQVFSLEAGVNLKQPVKTLDEERTPDKQH